MMLRHDRFDRTRNDRRSGVSLLEVIVAIFLVGTLLVSAITTSGRTFSAYRASSDKVRAHMILTYLLSEAMAQPFEDLTDWTTTLGVESGEDDANRSGFDDFDDYHGWSAKPEKKNGHGAGYFGWTSSFSVTYWDVTSWTASGTATGTKRMTITLTDPAGNTYTMSGLRTSWGDRPRSNTDNAIAAIVLLKPTDTSETFRPAVPLLNQLPLP